MCCSRASLLSTLTLQLQPRGCKRHDDLNTRRPGRQKARQASFEGYISRRRRIEQDQHSFFKLLNPPLHHCPRLWHLPFHHLHTSVALAPQDRENAEPAAECLHRHHGGSQPRPCLPRPRRPLCQRLHPVLLLHGAQAPDSHPPTQAQRGPLLLARRRHHRRERG
jgi:hypothetical protein